MIFWPRILDGMAFESLVLWKGAAAGLAIAAPVGPIGLLCIRRTLNRGRLAGFVSGLGAASADLIYGMAAATGITALNAWLLHRASWLSVAGAVFLIALGIRTWRERPAGESASARDGGLGASFGSTFLLTLTNPMTIVFFAGLMAGLGAMAASSSAAPFSLAAGVFLGSAAWWLVLAGTTGLLRHRLSPDALRWVNRAPAVALIGFGLNTLRTAMIG
ncbi:MAG: LysE family transporter [Bryobacteraceae bacterium]|jgi:threonine/homoserine/homoserine lactone efflux protein